eukprot:774936_1
MAYYTHIFIILLFLISFIVLKAELDCNPRYDGERKAVYRARKNACEDALLAEQTQINSGDVASLECGCVDRAFEVYYAGDLDPNYTPEHDRVNDEYCYKWKVTRTEDKDCRCHDEDLDHITLSVDSNVCGCGSMCETSY